MRCSGIVSALAGGIAAMLGCAATAVAAPPAISGADGDAWRTPPTYVVAGGTGGVFWSWSSTGRSGQSATSPFQVRLAGLRDGEHRLVVTQANDSPNPRFEQSVRTFVVDTAAPRALRVSGPSGVTAGQTLTVAWTRGEQDAVYTWRVVVTGASRDDDDDEDDEGDDTSVDAPVRGPVDTIDTSTAITGLAPGAYRVLVTQRDRAGNVSPAAGHPVTVEPDGSGAATSSGPAPAPSASPPATLPPTVLRLPARNTTRLRPKRSATIRVRRPVLRWTPGPRGTTLYNVQIFRVRTRPSSSSAAPAVTLRKVSSSFPLTNRMRTRLLARGACYVWRVWPYRAGAFTRRPLGVSSFCVSRAAPTAATRR